MQIVVKKSNNVQQRMREIECESEREKPNPATIVTAMRGHLCVFLSLALLMFLLPPFFVFFSIFVLVKCNLGIN